MNEGWVYMTDFDAMPIRSGVGTTCHIWWVLKAMKSRSPSLPVKPHPTQKAAPTGAMVGVKNVSGMIGFGPSWLVLAGGFGGMEQVSFGPQPKLPPPVAMLISSLHSGPFSVSQRREVSGSKVNPNELRWP